MATMSSSPRVGVGRFLSSLVIGPVNAPLTQLLRMSPGFKLAYEDKVAAVFVARKALSGGPAGAPGADKLAAQRADN